MNVMREKLTEAKEAKNNDIKSFVWKLARKADGTHHLRGASRGGKAGKSA